MASKKGDDKSDVSSLIKLVISLEEAEKKLEQSYKNKKPEQFQSIKKFILKLNDDILKEIK